MSRQTSPLTRFFFFFFIYTSQAYDRGSKKVLRARTGWLVFVSCVFFWLRDGDPASVLREMGQAPHQHVDRVVQPLQFTNACRRHPCSRRCSDTSTQVGVGCFVCVLSGKSSPRWEAYHVKWSRQSRNKRRCMHRITLSEPFTLFSYCRLFSPRTRVSTQS